MQLHALSKVAITPLAKFGLTHKFWTIHLDTLICTWVSMGLLALFVFFVRKNINKPTSLVNFGVEKTVEFFSGSVTEAFGRENFDCTAFIIGMFFFTLFANVCGVLPFLKESTLDLNTTMAIATVCFLYVQYQAILAKRFGYVTKFLKPIFIFLPINIIGQLSKIASLSFRLFGNIVGGAIIWDLLYQNTLVRIKTPFSILCFVVIPAGIILNRLTASGNFEPLKKSIRILTTILQLIPGALIFFGIFEGVMHAFVIALLTSMYISAEVGSDSAH